MQKTWHRIFRYLRIFFARNPFTVYDICDYCWRNATNKSNKYTDYLRANPQRQGYRICSYCLEKLNEIN